MAEKLVKDSQGLANDLVNDCVSRQAAVDAINSLINRFEQILRDIRETNVDNSVCGMCEYDGAYIGQSGDWCNECPGFDKDDCFKLSDECRKRWMGDIALPAVQPATNCSEFPNNSDIISRQAAIDALHMHLMYRMGTDSNKKRLDDWINSLPSAQPETHDKRTESHACDLIDRAEAIDGGSGT